jgi:hypothetical protein
MAAELNVTVWGLRGLLEANLKMPASRYASYAIEEYDEGRRGKF